MLVGRDAELAVLDALIAQAKAGAGGVVLLTGEPGAGKTRLARAGAERAAGATVSWGSCRESEGAPPLWPWMQVLRHLGGPRIATGTAEGAEGAAARYRLYERVGSTLREQAEAQPHLVVIDDLHRADEASLRLLAYLSETLWPASIGMVVTYRDTEVPPASLTANVVAGLARGPGCHRCELTGLSPGSVAQWLGAAGLDRVDPADLHARTGGNPLFISESIQLLLDGARPDAPLRSVGEVIRERLAPLPPACREALEVASVLGRDFEYPPLAAALAISPAAVIAALDPAVNARLIDPAVDRAGAYRFVHTLIRDAVEEQLAPSRRAGLHARAFTALRDTGWGQAADLAHHAAHGRPGVSDEVAADAARSAAEAADRLLAFQDAATWWRTAIALSQRQDGLDTDLEMRLGRSLLLAGQVDQARDCFEAVAREAARTDDGVTLAASALAAGDTVAEVAADHRLVALLDLALRHPGVPPGPRARLTARRAIATYWQPGGQDESRRVSSQAVRLAADAYRIGQLSRIYAKQGRLPELEDDIAAAVVRFPGLVTLRCMRALARATAGRRADAAAEIEALANDGFAALPRDSLYLASLAILAEAAVICRVTDAAKKILAELTPYAARNLIQGVPVGWGAAAWYIARLQWLLGRQAEATRSAAKAQRLHRQWGAAGLGDPLAGLRRNAAAAPLSQRETEVITLLSSGRENSEIAAVLGVSVHTVERHVANVFVKIGVRNRAEATAWAHRRGLAP